MQNKTLIQYFEWYVEGNHILWRKCQSHAADLARIGITAVWLPPAYKSGFLEDNVGYAAYDLYDLGEFDQKGSVSTKYGTREEYLDAIAEFHRQGVEVLADIVLNHKMGADDFEEVNVVRVNPQNRNETVSGQEKIYAPTKFTFPGRNGRYSKFQWDASCFNGVDWDQYTSRNCIFRLEGKEWAGDVDRENGNYDFLMGANVDVGNPKVRGELLNWGQWYVDQTGIDGFRLDAVKHVSASFYAEWLSTLRKNNKREFFAVGEYWHGDVNRLEEYLRQVDYSMSLFDVPLHYHIFEMSFAKGGYDLRRLFDDTLVRRRPDNAVTFVDNHDSQPGQALGSFVNTWMKQVAYAVILLHEHGVPCIFYGDLYGIPYSRSIPIPRLRTMIRVRSRYAYGPQHEYLDDPNVIGWTREGDGEHEDSGIAVLLADGPQGGRKRMYVGKQFAGMDFHDCMRKIRETVTVDGDGFGDFSVQNESAAIWVTTAAYEYLIINED